MIVIQIMNFSLKREKVLIISTINQSWNRIKSSASNIVCFSLPQLQQRQRQQQHNNNNTLYYPFRGYNELRR